MPVIEHEIHERTQHGADFRYGCWNRTHFAPGYVAPDRRYLPDGNYLEAKVIIPHVMSTTCRYDMSLTDAGCGGCINRGSGEAYDRMVREHGQ